VLAGVTWVKNSANYSQCSFPVQVKKENRVGLANPGSHGKQLLKLRLMICILGGRAGWENRSRENVRMFAVFYLSMLEMW